MSVLVTGGAGYIGSATVDALLARGERVVVLDDLSTGHRDAVASGAEFERADVGDADILRRLISQYDVRVVIHFAALTSTTESVRHPGRYFQTNVVKTLTLLEAMREAEVGSMVFSSSAAVYGDPQSVPIDERHPTGPINPYGCSKLMAEQMIEAHGKAHGIRCVALRYFNAAGGSPVRGEDHRPETHLIPLALRAAQAPGFELKIYGVDYPTPDGTCVRDYIHIEDLAAAHVSASLSSSACFAESTCPVSGSTNAEKFSGAPASA